MDDAVEAVKVRRQLRGKPIDLLLMLDVANVDRGVADEFADGSLAFRRADDVDDLGARLRSTWPTW